MGTSQSSEGPCGGVPMVPPWVPPLVQPVALVVDDGIQSSPIQPQMQARPVVPTLLNATPTEIIPVAPAGRFRTARFSLGRFAHSGDGGDLRRAVGRYIRDGYRGSGTASRRFAGTSSTAAALHSVLSSNEKGHSAGEGSKLDPILLSGRSTREVIDAIVQSVRPSDGTQDAEANRASIRDALCELLTKFQEADPLNLKTEEREFVVEQFVAIDVFRRFQLDLGKTIQEKAPSARTALVRLKEVKDYVKETISASFRKLREKGQRMITGRVREIAQSALRETMAVFEGYAE